MYGRMIPSVNVGVCQKWGLMELFGVIAPTLRAIITVIYEHERLCLATTRHDDVVTSVNWATSSCYNCQLPVSPKDYRIQQNNVFL